VTVHIGTEKGGGITRVGNNNMFMINTHIGHDAQIGSDCVLANNVMIAGHCVVGDHVNMMGLAGLHHFVTIGRFAYLGGACRIHHDVPPFVKVDGADEIRGLNKVGLARAGTSAEEIRALDVAYRRLFSKKRPLAVAMEELESLNGELTPHVREILDFLRRRNEGKHGRYLEGKRSELAAAIAEVAPAIATTPPVPPVIPAPPPSGKPSRHEHADANGNANGDANGNGSSHDPDRVEHTSRRGSGERV
jgi:UDP-N-acetylglucosamine acyltransferase